MLSVSGSDSDCDEFYNEKERQRRVSLSLMNQVTNESETSLIDDQINNRMPKLYFVNENEEILSVYKRVIYGKQVGHKLS